jgi:hypothetical protein
LLNEDLKKYSEVISVCSNSEKDALIKSLNTENKQ